MYKGDNRPAFRGLDEKRYNAIATLPTPCYVIDEARLVENGRTLDRVRKESGAKILLAQKAFSNYDLYPVIEPYLDGTEASGLYEARLGSEEMGHKECHVFCGAYREDEFEELLKYADHIVFNSPSQLKMFGEGAKLAGKSIGLRVNPELSTQGEGEIYDPCAPKSRLGTTIAQWELHMTDELIAMLDGIHFHTLCEQNSDALAQTVAEVKKRFGKYMYNLSWVNFGGGHHITRDDYDIDTLCQCIRDVADTYKVQVYLEPGEAVALNAGYLVTQVLDIVENDGVIAILDMSPACHTPDVIEMPYRPPLMNGYDADDKAYTYRFGGPTCLAGDVLGDYSFDESLSVGDKLVLGDMAIYSTCKNNTFNGMKLPDIYKLAEDGSTELVVEFGYEDFKYRLGGRKC